MFHRLAASLLIVGALVLGAASEAQAQELALSPARLELPVARGGSKTVVINVLNHVPKGKKGHPVRMLASLGDWGLSPQGKISFAKAGTTARSATPWITYSPTEFVIAPGHRQSIRMTISVPRGAPSGDHRAALFVRPRPPSLKSRTNKRQVQVSLRLMAALYITVPKLTVKPRLVNLSAIASGDEILVTARLKNDGNHLVRPAHGFEILDARGKVAGALPGGTAKTPLLGGHELKLVLKLKKRLPPGRYAIRYRARFEKQRKVIEGRTRLEIR